MLKDIFEKIDYFWFFLFVTVFVCFGYFFTNPTIGVDDEIITFFTSTEIILQVGRLGKFLTNLLFQPQFVPMVYDFVGISCFVMSIVLMCDILKKYLPDFSKQEMTIFSTIAISFPFVAFVFIFTQNCIDLGLCFLFATIAANFFTKYLYEDKKKKYLFITFIMLFLSLSMYETGLFYFLLIPIFIALYSSIFCNKKISLKEVTLQILSAFSTVVITVVTYQIVLKLVMHFLDFSYNKLDSYLKYDFSSFNAFFSSIQNCFNEFIKIFCINANNHFCCKMIVFSCISLLLISIYYSIRRKNIMIVLLSLIISILPLSYFILTGFAHMQYRIFFAYGIVNAISFVLLYKIFSKNIYLKQVFMFLCFFAVFHQAKEINAMFFTEHLKFENDKLFAYSVDKDLKRLNLEYFPIVFVGVKDIIEPEFSYYGLANELNASIFNWDRIDNKDGELTTKRPYKFMQQLGYNIYPYFDDNKKPDEYIKQLESIIPTLNIYPKEGSIKKVDDFVIIKIGKSRFDDRLF